MTSQPVQPYECRNQIYAKTLALFDVKQSAIAAATLALERAGYGKQVDAPTLSRYLRNNKSVSIPAQDALDCALLHIGGEIAFSYYKTNLEYSFRNGQLNLLPKDLEP